MNVTADTTPHLRVLFLYPNLPLLKMVPIAIGTLNACLKNMGDVSVVTDIFDCTMYLQNPDDPENSSECYRQKIGQLKDFDLKASNWDINSGDIKADFRQKVLAFRPDVVAISATDYTHGQSDELIRGIHDWYNPKVFVISGGIYPTMLPKYALRPVDMDALCIGEGRRCLEYVCRAIATGLDPHRAPNLAYISYGRVTCNPMAPLDNLDELPIVDYSVFPKERMTRQWFGKSQVMLPISINVGCPYSCNYCANNGFHALAEKNHLGGYIRYKSVEYLKKEMRSLTEQYHPEMWYFSSENFFTYPSVWMEEFSKFYIGELGAPPFWSETRVEDITLHNVKLLKAMGVSRLSIGLEAGNEAFRVKRCNKTFTNKQFLDAVKLCAEYGVDLTINNIVGLVDSRREYEFDTIDLNRKALAIANGRIKIGTTVTIFSPASGSKMHDDAVARGLFDMEKYIDQSVGSFHRDNWLYQPHFPPDEVKHIYEAFVLYVHLPKSYWAEIDRAVYNSLETTKADKYTMLMKLFRERYEQ